MVDYQLLDTFLAVLSIPFILVGVAGNVLVIYIVHSTQIMHSTTNFLLVNLAVSDCLTLLVWPLHWQIWWREKRLYGITGELLCKTFTGVTIIDVFCVVSSFTLTTLAIERYHALMKPFHTSLRLSIEYVQPTIAIIWFSSILLCLPDFILRSLDNEFNSCVGPWTMHMDNRSRIYVICNLVLSVYVPFFILLFCYGSVIRGLYFTNTVCASEPIEHSQSNQEKKQLVITFVSVTAGFFVCFIPPASQFMYLACTEHEADITMHEMCYQFLWFLLMATSTLNPILYAFRSTNFRNGFRRIITFPCKETSQRVQNIPLE